MTACFEPSRRLLAGLTVLSSNIGARDSEMGAAATAAPPTRSHAFTVHMHAALLAA